MTDGKEDLLSGRRLSPVKSLNSKMIQYATALLVLGIAALLVFGREAPPPPGTKPAPRVGRFRLVGLLRKHAGDFDAVLDELRADPEIAAAGIVALPRIPLLPRLHFAVGDAATPELINCKQLSMFEGIRLLIGNFNHREMAGDEQFIAVVFEELNKHMDSWPESGEFDVFETLYHLTTELLAKAIMGQDDLDADALRRFSEDVRIVDPQEGLMRGPWIPLLPRWLFHWTAEGRNVMAAHERLVAMVSEVAKKRMARAQTGKDGERDFFRYLMDELVADDDKAVLDTEYLTFMVVSLIIAANSNTFATACWTMINLVSHPEHMARAKAEIAEARLAHPDLAAKGTMNASLLDSLVFIEACLRENLRVKGSILLLKTSHLHGLEHLFSDGAYRPERHLASGGGIDRSLARQGKLFVFGAGRHACIGEKVATQVIKMQIVNMVERFEKFELVKPVSGNEQQIMGVMRPAEPAIIEYKMKSR
ncbi:cytochrome P450 [Hyaloraphidium curvatum]|nr:cytochrome P450 [Hyaloraphidium curvatum]